MRWVGWSHPIAPPPAVPVPKVLPPSGASGPSHRFYAGRIQRPCKECERWPLFRVSTTPDGAGQRLDVRSGCYCRVCPSGFVCGPRMRFSSATHSPRSISLHRSLQKGRHGFSGTIGHGVLQVGQRTTRTFRLLMDRFGSSQVGVSLTTPAVMCQRSRVILRTRRRGNSRPVTWVWRAPRRWVVP